MPRIAMLIGILLCFSVAPAARAEDKNPPSGLYCAHIDVVLKDIVGKRKIGYFADAIGTDGLVHMWFVRSQGRDWVQISIREDLTACIIAEGIEWGFALEPAQVKTPQMDYIEQHNLFPKPAEK